MPISYSTGVARPLTDLGDAITTLQITLLGTPDVQIDNTSLKFRSKKELALFIYLAVEAGWHSRDSLIALLWPESDRKRGRLVMRTTLSTLRKRLAGAGEAILTAGDRVALNPELAVMSDTKLVKAAVAPTASVVDWETAVAQTRSDFLAGFSLADAPAFDDWAYQQRILWKRHLEAVYDKLSHHQLEEGQIMAGLQTAVKWVDDAPFSEAAYRRLMKAYVLYGDRSAALKIYEQCQQHLTGELNISPSVETQQLAERIMADATPVAAVSALAFAAHQQPLAIPFVGRRAEQKQLRRIYQQALQGEAQIAVIIGEAGLGKTQLVETFMTWARLGKSDVDLLRGRAFEMGGNLPYQALVEALRRRLDQENAPDDLLDDVWLAELSQLLPELRVRYPDLPLPMVGNADFVRGRLFEAVANLGIALAAKRPLILFIDDIQWADSSTQDMLHYVTQRWTVAQQPILILFTVRKEGLLAQPALRDWLTSLHRDNNLSRIELSPLTQAELQQLMKNMAGSAKDTAESAGQLGAWLQAETNGSPFFVSELLQMMVEQNILVGSLAENGQLIPDLAATLSQIQAMDHMPLPPNVREVMLARLNQLSEKARSLLLVAAVIGRECSFERLCQTAGLDTFAALPALEELLVGGLILETQNEERPFTFAHDNIRDVVYTEAGATRRRLYHRRIFTLLAEEQTPAAELAFHAVAARLHEPAFHFSVAAGDNALQLNAFTEAVLHYNRALEFVEQLTLSPVQWSTLYSQRGRALELCGHYKLALENYQTMLKIGRQLDAPRLELAALVAEGTIRSTANELSDFELGEQLADAALVLAQQLDDKAAEARIQWNMLNIYRMTNRNEQALHAGERALALAEEIGLQEVMAFSANDLVYIYMAKGKTTHTLSYAQKAIALWRELGNQPMLTDSLINYANMQAIIGNYETALDLAAEALQISRSLDNLWAQSYSLYTYSIVYWRTMQVDEALSAMNSSIHLANSAGFTGAQVLIRVFQAQLLLALGDVSGAYEVAETAAVIAAEKIPLFLPASQGVQAQVALQAGQGDLAKQIIAAGGFNALPFSLMNFCTPETAVCLQALSAGSYDQVVAFSTPLLDALHKQGLRLYVPDFLYFQAQALVGLHRADEARVALAEALAMLRETGSRWYLPQIAGLLADLEEQAGHQNMAAKLRREALATLDFVLEHIPDREMRITFETLS